MRSPLAPPMFRLYIQIDLMDGKFVTQYTSCKVLLPSQKVGEGTFFPFAREKAGERTDRTVKSIHRTLVSLLLHLT